MLGKLITFIKMLQPLVLHLLQVRALWPFPIHTSFRHVVGLVDWDKPIESIIHSLYSKTLKYADIGPCLDLD